MFVMSELGSAVVGAAGSRATTDSLELLKLRVNLLQSRDAKLWKCWMALILNYIFREVSHPRVQFHFLFKITGGSSSGSGKNGQPSDLFPNPCHRDFCTGMALALTQDPGKYPSSGSSSGSE